MPSPFETYKMAMKDIAAQKGTFSIRVVDGHLMLEKEIPMPEGRTSKKFLPITEDEAKWLSNQFVRIFTEPTPGQG